MSGRPKVVILGMLTKIPVGGVVWLIGQYAVGFQRLGCDVYYVEAHGRTPSMFIKPGGDDGIAEACRFIDRNLARFGLAGKWAFDTLHDDDACYGMSRGALTKLYAEAALIINLHGGTVPLDEHAATGRLVYIGTDPVDVEIELANEVRATIDFLEPHVAFFTWALNYGGTDCLLPWSERFTFRPSPPPIVADLWDGGPGPGARFTTIGNWRQEYRNITFNGERYTWSKRDEFLRIIDLPNRVSQPIELALSSYGDEDRVMLEAHGWQVRAALPFSANVDQYRKYVRNSRGEFSVAKDQNVRFKTGWFSERSATYLAASRPVILQDTGFANALPCGEGLLSFADLDSAAQAFESIGSAYDRHSRAARELALGHLSYDVVLPPIMDAVGLPTRHWPTAPASTPLTAAACLAPAGDIVEALGEPAASVAFSYAPRESSASFAIDIQGTSDDDHIIKALRRSTSFYELDLLEHIADVSPRKGTYIDVGANIGNHSVFFGRVLGVEVMAVEPNPLVLPHLQRNLRINGVDATIVPWALADRAGQGEMRLDPAFEQNVGATRVEFHPADSMSRPCVITTVDAMLNRLAPTAAVALVKIDVEGMELEVLRGARRLLSQQRPDVVVEAAEDEAHERVTNMLSDFGYTEIGRFCATPTYHFRAA